jgi:hypothetical protein
MSKKKQPTVPVAANGAFPDEDPDIRKDVADLILEWEQWLDTPHALLMGRKPNDLIGTKDEVFVRNLLRSIKYGIPT